MKGQELLSVLTPTFFREHPEAGSAGCVMKTSDWKRFQHEHGREWCQANFALCPHTIIDDIYPPTMGDFFPEGVASEAILHRPDEPALDAPAVVEAEGKDDTLKREF